MLNLHAAIITNNLNNTVCEELPAEWLSRLSPETNCTFITGYYNAGILTISMADFNKDSFYDEKIKLSFEYYCKELCSALEPIVKKCLRRMFTGFNSHLTEYNVVLFLEGADGDGIEPIKYTIKII